MESKTAQDTSVWSWIKAHKKELLLAGVSIATVIAIIAGIKNKDVIKAFLDSLLKTPKAAPDMISVMNTAVELSPVPEPNIIDFQTEAAKRASHEVSEHLRNLPRGCNPSTEKVATALEHGFVLHPGQTWVESYRTGGVAA